MKKRSLQKRIFRFLKVFSLTLLTFLFFLVLIGKIAEQKITRLAFNKLKESLKVPLQAKDISFSLLTRFPLATVEFDSLWVGYPVNTKNISPTDTLLTIGKVYISASSTKLIDEVFDIRKVEISGAEIDYAIDKNGNSNLDFLVDTTNNNDSDTSALNLTIQNLFLKNITCNFSDSVIRTEARIHINEATIAGKIKNNTYNGSSRGNVTVSEYRYRDISLNNLGKANVTFDIGYMQDSLNFKNLKLLTTSCNLSAEGSLVLKNKISVSLNVKGEKLDLAGLKPLVPEEFLKKYFIKNASGLVSFDASLNGFMSDSLMPRIDAKVNLKEGKLEMTKYPELKNISFAADFTNGEQQNNRTTKITFNELHFETDSSKADMQFSAENFNRPAFNANAQMDVYLQDVSRFLPDSLPVSLYGKVKSRLTLAGIMPDSISAAFFEGLLRESKMKLELQGVSLRSDSFPRIDSLKGTIEYSPGNLAASGISVKMPEYNLKVKDSYFNTFFSGKIDKPRSVTIDSCSFFAASASSSIAGSFFFKNLPKPVYGITGNAELNLSEIDSIFHNKLINNVSGNLISTFSSEGSFDPDSSAGQITYLILKKSSLDIEMENVTANLQDTLFSFSDVSGKLKIMPDTISVKNISGRYKSVDFKANSVKIANLYDTYFQNLPEQLYVEGYFKFGNIKYSDLTPFMGNAVTIVAPDTVLAVKRPNLQKPKNITKNYSNTSNYTYLIKGKLSIDDLKYKKAAFKNISGLFSFSNNTYVMDKLAFDAFGGRMVNSLKYRITSGNRQVISFRSNIEKMNISQLLKDFDNFSMKDLTSEKISGVVSSDVEGWALLLGDTLVTDSLYLKGSLTLENGGLYNYEPAQQLADFTKIKELDNIRFKTLKSKLFIFKNAMYVPQTEIKSTAMDITVYGMKSFGSDYEYHLRLYLSELLRGKNKHILKKQAEMEDSPGKKKAPRSLYVVSYSLNGKIKNGFDSKKLRQQMNLKIKLQENVLNVVFHPKLFKFDTNVPEHLKNILHE